MSVRPLVSSLVLLVADLPINRVSPNYHDKGQDQDFLGLYALICLLRHLLVLYLYHDERRDMR